jgi:hypothetical protein
MHDDKRRLRQLKRDIKKQGNRKRRRFYKDVTVAVDNFDFGLDSSRLLNEQRTQRDEQQN